MYKICRFIGTNLLISSPVKIELKVKQIPTETFLRFS